MKRIASTLLGLCLVLGVLGVSISYAQTPPQEVVPWGDAVNHETIEIDASQYSTVSEWLEANPLAGNEIDGLEATCVTYKYPQGECATSDNVTPNNGNPTAPLDCHPNGPFSVEVTMFVCAPAEIDGAFCTMFSDNGGPVTEQLTLVDSENNIFSWWGCFETPGDVPEQFICYTTATGSGSTQENSGFEDLWIEYCCTLCN